MTRLLILCFQWAIILMAPFSSYANDVITYQVVSVDGQLLDAPTSLARTNLSQESQDYLLSCEQNFIERLNFLNNQSFGEEITDVSVIVNLSLLDENTIEVVGARASGLAIESDSTITSNVKALSDFGRGFWLLFGRRIINLNQCEDTLGHAIHDLYYEGLHNIRKGKK